MAYAATALADTPVLYWRLGDASGPAVADASGNGQTGTAQGGITFTQAGLLRADGNTALHLDGAAGADYQSVVLADAPLAYWPLQETSGTAAADASGQGHDGTYPTDGTITLGQPGPCGALCALFNDSYGGVAGPGGPGISLANPATFPVAPTALSVAFWANPSGPVLGPDDFPNWFGTVLGLGDPDNDTAYLTADLWVNRADGSAPTPTRAVWLAEQYESAGGLLDGVFVAGLWLPDTWHHVVLTWDNADGARWNVYLDGAAIAGGDLTTTQPFDAQSGSYSAAWLGATAASWQQTLVGGLAHVALYDHALSAARVRAQYDALATPGARTMVVQDATSTLPAAASIELWLQTTTTQGGVLAQFATADGTSRDLTLYLRTDGVPAFRAGNSEIVRSGDRTVADGRIHHLVATLDGDAAAWLSVDGSVAAHVEGVTPASPFTGRWQIGAGTTDDLAVPPASAAYAGTLDEVAIYTD